MRTPQYQANRELLARMRALGVRWQRFPKSCPFYPASMSQAQKDAANKLYDSMIDPLT